MNKKTTDLLRRLPRDKPVSVSACLLGERLHLRGLYEPPPELGPLALPAGEAGLAIVFRYGAVVMFNLSNREQKTLLKDLRSRVEKPLRKLEMEDAQIILAPKQPEGTVPEGIRIKVLSLARLQVVATVMARSVALDYYETMMAGAFDLIEPLALQLEQQRGGGRRLKQLLRYTGGTLTVQHKMIGRVGIQEKPEMLWDHPEPERLYVLLEREYELQERGTVLERKLSLINDTAKTTVNLLQNRSTLRVEWYIVILIVIEVVLYSYDLWFKD